MLLKFGSLPSFIHGKRRSKVAPSIPITIVFFVLDIKYFSVKTNIVFSFFGFNKTVSRKDVWQVSKKISPFCKSH